MFLTVAYMHIFPSMGGSVIRAISCNLGGETDITISCCLVEELVILVW